MTLDVGFGWNTDELADHGVPARRRRTVLREDLDAMRALWTDDVASREGEHVTFGPSWAWPKPVQRRIPVLVGAAGAERTFRWIARSADGWLTTPSEVDVEEDVGLLREIWRAEGRTGEPEVAALGPRPDPEGLARPAAAGVTEVIFGRPDREPDEVVAWLGRLAGKLDHGTLIRL